MMPVEGPVQDAQGGGVTRMARLNLALDALAVREVLMILFVSLSTLGSQLLLKRAAHEVATRDVVPTGGSWLLAMLSSPPVIAAVVIQAVGFLVWLAVISRVKLGVAFALSGGFFYVLMAAASWLVYGERLIASQWLGILLITAGVCLLSISGGKG